jgi:hypothetical protein
MEQEIFTIQVPYNGQAVDVEIRTAAPKGPDDADHEVWLAGQLAFVIEPHLDVCDSPCWQLKTPDPRIDLELVSNIGMEIERHYL